MRAVHRMEGSVIVVRLSDGTLAALEDRCSHDDGELCTGKLEDDAVVCPRHGARFDPRTGEALTPPAYEPIERFPVRVRGGWIEVEL